MHKNPCKTVHLIFFICSPFVNPVDCRLFINISKDIWHKKTQTHRTARNHFLADDHKRSSNWLHFCDIGDRKVEYIIGKKKKRRRINISEQRRQRVRIRCLLYSRVLSVCLLCCQMEAVCKVCTKRVCGPLVLIFLLVCEPAKRERS